MRALAAFLALVAVSGCSRTMRPAVTPPGATPPGPTSSERLVAADALVRAGCFDCLQSAYREYDALRAIAAAGDAAAIGAVRSAALLSIRERELGTEDSGYLVRAREIAATIPAVQQPLLATLLDVADSLPTRGAAQQLSTDGELGRMQAASRNRDLWTEQLRAHADEDALSAYLWLGFNCAYTGALQQTLDEWLTRLPVWRETPLVAFKTAAACGRSERAALDRLLQADGRFIELNYFLSVSEAFRGRIDPAMEHLQKAYAWRPRWPAVTNSLATDYITLEEFDQAVDFFDRTLAVVPNYTDAFLGKVRALTYAGRHIEALATVDQWLVLNRYVGDARYWRALNEAQLERYDEAWTDIELSAKLLINAEVPKLAGIIAYRRKQLDVSRAKFEESRERKRDDCETGYYLGVVLAEQRVWDRTSDVLVETGACLEAAELAERLAIAGIRESNAPEPRKQRQIAKREQQIVNGRRMMATSWFDIAVASYNLSRKTEARQYAEKVADDEQFGERARDLLSRLKNDDQRRNR